MILDFVKMHGTGNDYIYIDCTDDREYDFSSLAKRLSDRHRGIGADGLVVLCKSEHSDVKMRMFNADGSEGKMCGNAIRCVAKLAYEKLGIKRQSILVETLSGVKTIYPTVKNGVVTHATVDMGIPSFEPKDIPTLVQDAGRVLHTLNIGGNEYNVVLVSVGNPHCVVFCSEIEGLDLPKLGVGFEKLEIFPKGINTEFVKITSPTSFDMRVWERGSGETLACGTGACASLAAGVATGQLESDVNVTAKLLGGELILKYTDLGIIMTGDCVEVFTGKIEV